MPRRRMEVARYSSLSARANINKRRPEIVVSASAPVRAVQNVHAFCNKPNAVEEKLMEIKSAMRSGNGSTLAPLIEGPTEEFYEDDDEFARKDCSWNIVRDWVRVTWIGFGKPADLRLLLGVLGCPLAPVTVLCNEPFLHVSIKDVPIETSSARYIVHQYIAATGCTKLQSLFKSSYTLGKLKMLATEFETASKVSRNSSKSAETGCFVLWQMMPDMWLMELVVAHNKIHAGSNGKVVWRQTPWLGPHAAKGPARPLRRALQGIDPRTTASMFVNARCVGEKRIGEEDCFTLKLAADPSALAERNDGPAEIIRHVLFGYFSQKTGLLVYMEDSHLTRIQANGEDAVYWETTIETTINDYRPVDGVMIAHSGQSIVTVFRFGSQFPMSYTKTRMEETWTIEEVVFNVPGLSGDCFIPPADIRNGSVGGNACDLKFGKLENKNV